MNKWWSLLSLSIAASFLFASVASAHVVVYPKETTQGIYEMFTVRVPSEKEVPTVKVEVKIPADVDVSRFEPKAGWKYDLNKDSTNKITSVIWSATGDGLSATEFGDFNMQGKVGDKATSLVFKAIQTYKDGTVVEWTGAPDAKTPASVTTVKAKASGAKTDGHGDDHGDNALATAAKTTVAGPEDGHSDSSRISLYLSIAAIILGMISILIALSKKSRA